jgi:hypothetical protein
MNSALRSPFQVFPDSLEDATSPGNNSTTRAEGVAKQFTTLPTHPHKWVRQTSASLRQILLGNHYTITMGK